MTSHPPAHAEGIHPAPAAVARAVRLTYAQMMLGAVFGASTGGMFLIGFALSLGADNIYLGLLGTVPPCLVAFQFLAAYLVERGISRKQLTFWFALAAPLCWLLVAAIPFMGERITPLSRLGILLGVVALVTISNQFSGNARASWLGELIHESRRGRFFGTCTLFAGIVGMVFAVAEGGFLDFARAHGTMGFAALFIFGSVFGLAMAMLNLPQPDCPLPHATAKGVFWRHLREGLRNRPLVILALAQAVMSLGNVAAPFNAAYMLRDVKLSFFGIGVLNALATISLLVTAPMWGRLIDRFGCRPILITGLLIAGPMAYAWLLVPPGAWQMAYTVMPVANVICNIGMAAVTVAITTLLYKLTSPRGRSVQFAGYGVFVSLVSAPMPLLGGVIVNWLQSRGWHVDLRLTFYGWGLFMLMAAGVAYFLPEPRAIRTRTLVLGYFPGLLMRWWSGLAILPLLLGLVRPTDDEK
ncbi:MAG: MFS transporter [Planctomycetaceae bacterium]|nr:MFS transporter [Planctomycetaceae bacterium]